MYLHSTGLSDNVGISIKNENLLTGLRLLTPSVFFVKIFQTCEMKVNDIGTQQTA